MVTGKITEKLSQIEAIFPSSGLTDLKITNDYISRYYSTNAIWYALFHSLGGFIHMGISRGEDYHKSDLLFQANLVQTFVVNRVGFQVLELGMGKGANTIFLGKNNSKAQFFGCDLSDKNIRIASAARRGIENIRIVSADFHDLSLFYENSIDLMFFVESLCHSNHKQNVLSEVFKTLRPGGKLIIVDGYRNKKVAHMSDVEQKASILVERGMAVDRFEEVEEFLALSRAVGFTHLEGEDLSLNIIPTVRRFETLAGKFFRRPRLARLISKIFPNEFLYNSVSGYLFPDVIIEKIFCYRYDIFQKQAAGHLASETNGPTLIRQMA